MRGGYYGFLMACYDDKNKEFQTIGTIGSGFWFSQQSEILKQNIIDRPRSDYNFHPCHRPNHWFNATQVWEITGSSLSVSHVWKAAWGLVDPYNGIELDYACLVRVQDGKTPEEATTAFQVSDMYRRFQCQSLSESMEQMEI